MPAKRKASKRDGRTKRAREPADAAGMARVRASLTRLQDDPDYVMQVILECQRRGVIPSPTNVDTDVGEC